jgi:hypothetical protein
MRRRRFLTVFLVFCLAAAQPTDGSRAAPQAHGKVAKPHREEAPGTPRGVEIVQQGAYPELRVDGVPFFLHSAAFFYYRIPRDLWDVLLDRHRELGLNTIDLYIPWNWHEPLEGQLDFDGHSNPRRDLRGLLKLIAEKGFKLVARPGPMILNEWRHGGYPEWLLKRPEYRMDAVDRLEGRYPPLATLNARDAEAAAAGWLENPTHLEYARKWLGAVARELAAYSANRTVRVKVREAKKEAPEEKEISGPLLFVQLDDDMAIGRTNYAGPKFWRYMDELRRMLEAGGLEVPVYINPTDMRVSAAGAGLEQPIGVMGQWYLSPAARPAASPSAAPSETRLSPHDVSTLEFFVETLNTQPAFPPILIEYQAGWYTPGDDARPLESPPANTLLSSRLLFAHGLHGLNYFPAQDTFSPAGYETPWANRYYRWDAALDLNGNRQPRARAVLRNARILENWGEFLAASHKRADFGIVYPLGAYPQLPLTGEDILHISHSVMRLERLAHLAGLASELLDPHYQPVEQILRHALVLLPVFDPAQEKFRLSEKAQRVLVEYVRRGGTLVYFPARPAGQILEELWKSSSERPRATGDTREWVFGQGRVIEWSKDFYSWIALDESFAQNRAQFESAWATQTLRDFLVWVGLRPAVKRAGAASASGRVIVTQLVSNTGTGALGARTAGRGLLSLTNTSDDEPADETFAVLSPRAGARGREEDYVSLAVSVPPRESLLLPLHYPLCSATAVEKACSDEVVAAGAELLWAERDAKTIELTFYTPARAAILLSLESQPRRVELEEMKPEA